MVVENYKVMGIPQHQFIQSTIVVMYVHSHVTVKWYVKHFLHLLSEKETDRKEIISVNVLNEKGKLYLQNCLNDSRDKFVPHESGILSGDLISGFSTKVVDEILAAVCF